jgi:hypothetical protein
MTFVIYYNFCSAVFSITIFYIVCGAAFYGSHGTGSWLVTESAVALHNHFTAIRGFQHINDFYPASLVILQYITTFQRRAETEFITFCLTYVLVAAAPATDMTAGTTSKIATVFLNRFVFICYVSLFRLIDFIFIILNLTEA